METTIAAPKASSSSEVDFLPLQGTDYVEFYVGNAKQAAHFYKTALAFKAWPMRDLKRDERPSQLRRPSEQTDVRSHHAAQDEESDRGPYL